ncbi:MAG TPA: TonB-dependent receptor [Chitinophagaceae bacterium]|nr:TonB-dependent receptor [Chitinophagaceae bacterium]
MSRFFYCLLLFPFISIAQNNTQTIRGIVSDKLTQMPLVGASVQIISLQQGTQTDSLGNYKIEALPPDRYEVKISYAGYKTVTIPNVVVTSGKQVIVDIAMEESFSKLGNVVVKAHNKGGTVNKLASVSARTFSMEEVNRYAGGRSDPARLVANFAGVSAPDDSRNDIVIRGNSPVGVLWRIDGMNVTNPNHFASVGTTGGAVSALNTNLLKSSDFFTSAFPAEYGNATAGVFDLGFRNGNSSKRETTLQVGVITGLEATTEGPFHKKSDASYLIGYRYALAGVAQKLGVNIGTTATPSYQDLSFKINSGNTKAGKFSMYGILATSTINIGGGSSGTLYGNGNKVDFASKIGILGLNHSKQINKKSFITTTLGIHYSSADQTGYATDRPTETEFTKEVNQVSKTGYNLSSTYHTKINSRLFFKAGIQDELIGLDLYYKTKNRIMDEYTQIWDSKNNTNLAQAFAHFKYNATERITINAGLHAQLFFLNQSTSVEPRLGLIFNVSPNSTLNVGYGLHAQMQPVNVYFLQSTNASGQISYNNKDLDFTKSHHVVIGYNIQPLPDWRIKTEVYYQSIYKVPVTTFESSYSMLNTGSTFKTDLQDSLVNEGTGKNYGIELTIERFFNKGYYGLFTSSLYRSKYTGSDGVERNTAFNGRYVFNLLAGKEWKLGRSQRNKFSTDIKMTNAGGRAYTPIDLTASNAIGHEQLSTDAYSSYYEPYYRIDIKAGYTLNGRKRKISHTLSLDLQNVTNHKNVFSQSYDDRAQKINTTYQLGFFPNVVYKLQF